VDNRYRCLLVVFCVALLAACGGDDGLEAASQELAQMEQKVQAAQAQVEAREAEARSAEDALKDARDVLAKAEKQLAEARARVAKQANDAVLFRNVQQRLLDDGKLRGVAVSARVQKRVVTLEGTVPSEELKTRAEQVAAQTTGVETVVNQIAVRAPTE